MNSESKLLLYVVRSQIDSTYVMGYSGHALQQVAILILAPREVNILCG